MDEYKEITDEMIAEALLVLHPPKTEAPPKVMTVKDEIRERKKNARKRSHPKNTVITVSETEYFLKKNL